MIQSKLLLWSIVSALAGFLFGFDTVVISGAEKTIQKLWDLSPEMHGVAMGAALWGTVLGSLVGSWPTDRFGRKTTLFSVGILFIVGSIWSAVAQEVYSFMIARFRVSPRLCLFDFLFHDDLAIDLGQNDGT